MRRFLFTLMAAAGLSGCGSDRVAGTEVGNPEVTVSARFGVMYADSSAWIPEMGLQLMGLDYWTAAASGTLGQAAAGRTVVFGEGDTSAMAMGRTGMDAWTRAEVRLQAAPGDTVPPVGLTFATYRNPRMIKIVKMAGADSLRLLFAMPAAFQIKLRYGQASLESWRRNDSLDLKIMFDGMRWCAPIGTPLQLRVDGSGKAYALVSPRENAVLHAQLAALLPQCFMADSVSLP